ncbi:hypothetical protein K1719_020325 [Acacia pycnantha]|nr:hypothetical protein K1719_020325 [Acacia pycnantha]
MLACDEACMVSDQQGMIPLHYAVMRDRLKVVIELIRAKPESLSIFHKGNTIFHLCVIYNRLKILKALVELDSSNTYKLLSSRDSDGNSTILHFSVMLKQVEDKVSADLNRRNNFFLRLLNTPKIPLDDESLIYWAAFYF